MDYKKKYKDALQRAKHALDCDRNNLVSTDVPLIYSMFPELAGSEDERIKKTLIDYFITYKKQEECGIKTFFGIPTDNVLAWLEKQGESYTKRDVDDAWLKGMCDAKRELEKQGEYKSSEELLKIRQELYQSGYNDGYKHGCEDTKKQSEQKPFDYENANIQQRDWAETPFGAKDSELQEVTYYIPQGYYAEIEDNKVVIKQGEKKTDWTEEDEKMVDNILTPLATRYPFDIYQPMYNWLKALKERVQPQTTWKPSDEQMKILRNEVEGWTKGCPIQMVLESLYNDLKNLK